MPVVSLGRISVTSRIAFLMGRNIGLPTNGGVKVDIVPKQFSLIFKKFVSFFFFFFYFFSSSPFWGVGWWGGGGGGAGM